MPESVNCFRQCKRGFRRKVKWNDWPMRYQLRVHLFTLFGGFFLAFFIFLAFFAIYYYKASVVDNLKPEWQPLLEDRLIFSSQSVASAFYMADNAFIDTVTRLQ